MEHYGNQGGWNLDKLEHFKYSCKLIVALVTSDSHQWLEFRGAGDTISFIAFGKCFLCVSRKCPPCLQLETFGYAKPDFYALFFKYPMKIRLCYFDQGIHNWKTFQLMSSYKMPVQAIITSVWWYHSCSIHAELGSWFGPWWVFWSSSLCSLTKLCWHICIGKTESGVARICFLDDSIIGTWTKSSYILVLNQFYFFRWNYMCSLCAWTECKFQLSYMPLSETGDSCISWF